MDLVSKYIVHLADNALILGHRNSEWTGHGPILEQDIALSNIALDLIGQARNFYQLAAIRINESNPGELVTEDDLAYLRDASEFSNLILLEQSNGDWAKTILREYYYCQFQLLQYQQLLNSKYPGLSAISEKSIKEIRYHVKWSSEWVLRLGDGTDESHERMVRAMDLLDPWIAEMFQSADFDFEAAATGAGIKPEALKSEWFQRINETLRSATLPQIIPESKNRMALSGKNGVHSDQLIELLSEMQILQRTYPGATW